MSLSASRTQFLKESHNLWFCGRFLGNQNIITIEFYQKSQYPSPHTNESTIDSHIQHLNESDDIRLLENICNYHHCT